MYSAVIVAVNAVAVVVLAITGTFGADRQFGFVNGVVAAWAVWNIREHLGRLVAR